MKTEELLLLLATGTEAVNPREIEQRLTKALAVGILLSALLMSGLLGLHNDLLTVLALPKFWIKIAFAAALSLASLLALLRLARPGVEAGLMPLFVTLTFLTLWGLAGWTLFNADAAQRQELIFGQTWMVCPWLIALLSAPLLSALLWALHFAAPTRPHLAGATAGLLAGALATLVYCIHCPEMETPFLAVWYVLGICIPAVLGAFLGNRLLRW